LGEIISLGDEIISLLSGEIISLGGEIIYLSTIYVMLIMLISSLIYWKCCIYIVYKYVNKYIGIMKFYLDYN
jgi:hypothetical protein